jgi:hypothetical protein
VDKPRTTTVYGETYGGAFLYPGGPLLLSETGDLPLCPEEITAGGGLYSSNESCSPLKRIR